jgi:hypothetical protein
MCTSYQAKQTWLASRNVLKLLACLIAEACLLNTIQGFCCLTLYPLILLAIQGTHFLIYFFKGQNGTF